MLLELMLESVAVITEFVFEGLLEFGLDFIADWFQNESENQSKTSFPVIKK